MNQHIQETSDGTFGTQVLQSEQPVLVDFWAAWCAPCRLIAPALDALAEQYKGTACVVKLNVDENPDTPQRYGIKGIPTLILFHHGREVERIVGAVPQEALARMINKHTGVARVSETRA